MDLRKLVRGWSKTTFLICKDTSKCGSCLREEIRSKVSEEFLSRHLGEVTIKDVVDIESETYRRLHKTPLYQKIDFLLESGHSLKEIEEMLLQDGIEI